MERVKKINHVAIVVADLDAALGFWRDGLGMEMSHVEDVPSQKSQVAFLPLGDSEVELVKPTSDDSGVAKYLAERGGGMHHLCFEVNDIDAMLAQLKGKGVRVINESPIVLDGRKLFFVHPKSAGGVLVEIYQLIAAEGEG